MKKDKNKELIERLEFIANTLEHFSNFSRSDEQHFFYSDKNKPTAISPRNNFRKIYFYEGGVEEKNNEKIVQIKRYIKFLKENGISLPSLFRDTKIKKFEDIISLKNELYELRRSHRYGDAVTIEGLFNGDIKEMIDAVNKDIFQLKRGIPISENEKKPIVTLPPKTDWKDLEIKFKDSIEIEIFRKSKFVSSADHIKLNFYKGKKNKKPDRQWQFLVLLSILQGKNEKNATNSQMAESLGKNLGKKISINNCEAIRKLLAKKMCKTFGIEDDPFYPHKEHGYYKTKFTLKPVPGMRGVRDTGEIFITQRNEFREGFGYGKKEPDEEGFTSL